MMTVNRIASNSRVAKVIFLKEKTLPLMVSCAQTGHSTVYALERRQSPARIGNRIKQTLKPNFSFVFFYGTPRFGRGE